MALLTVPVMATVVAQALGVSATLTGVYVAIAYIGAIFASLASGSAVARFGAIRVSQAGLLLARPACCCARCRPGRPWHWARC